MSTAEILANREYKYGWTTDIESEMIPRGLNEDTVISLFNQRQQTLEQIKPWVGLKFFYRTTEKIKQEEVNLRKLLRLENAKQTVLSDYSFVLDPAYFEQKFLTSH